MDNTSLLPTALLLDKTHFVIISAKKVMFEAVSVVGWLVSKSIVPK